MDNENVLAAVHLACAKVLAKAVAAEQRFGQPNQNAADRIAAARGFTAMAVQLTYAALRQPHGELCSLDGCHEATDQQEAVYASCALIDWSELLLGGLGPSVTVAISDERILQSFKQFDTQKERGAQATIKETLPAMEKLVRVGELQPKDYRGPKFAAALLPLVKQGHTDLAEAALEALAAAKG